MLEYTWVAVNFLYLAQGFPSQNSTNFRIILRIFLKDLIPKIPNPQMFLFYEFFLSPKSL